MNLKDRNIQLRIVGLYRAYKTNPKDYKLTEEDKKFLVEVIDIENNKNNIDGRLAPGNNQILVVLYKGYATDYFVSFGVAQPFRGEEYRAIGGALSKIIYSETVTILFNILIGETLPASFLIPAAYIELGISNDIIPKGTRPEPTMTLRDAQDLLIRYRQNRLPVKQRQENE